MNDLAALQREATRQLKAAPVEDFEALGRPVRGEGRGAAAAALPEGAGAALLDLRRGSVSSRARAWAAGFVAAFFTEIRGAICGAERPAVEGLTAKGVATALSGWIVGAIGVSSPIAFGLATLVVLVLGGALRSAFCTMTREEVLAALGPEAPAPG